MVNMLFEHLLGNIYSYYWLTGITETKGDI